MRFRGICKRRIRRRYPARKFAFLPRKLHNGTWIWLEYYSASRVADPRRHSTNRVVVKSAGKRVSPLLPRPASGSRFAIRLGDRDDRYRVIDIWCAAIAATHTAISPRDLKTIHAIVRDSWPSIQLWLAVDDHDYPIAFMMMTAAHMEALFVDPDFQDTRVQHALADHALTLQPELIIGCDRPDPPDLSLTRDRGQALSLTAIGGAPFQTSPGYMDRDQS